MVSWQPAYIGVGSNLDDPRSQVKRALARLAQLPGTRVILTSPMYASLPFGPVPQPDFINAVTGVLTQLEPRALLAHLRAIEVQFGRAVQHEKWGPRILDLDVLIYAHERSSDAELTLPHPGVVERNFVLYPLADIAPHLEVPGLGLVSELKARVSPKGLRQLL
jgi:2-amino-4-hydroxy-6-hydroxymethyldihydropteridine diphosphokinase